jgi:chemotaxis protein methyltransferase CheR
MQLTSATFNELRRAIHSLCGLVISDDKEYLIRDRLGPVIAARGLTSFDELCRQLQARPDDRLVEAVIDAVTTRETSFFRDPHVFQALRSDIYPRLAAEVSPPGRPIRIWSAGTSNGQEAYSLAMLAREYAAAATTGSVRPATFSIVASDISREAMRVARTGEYDARDVARGVSSARVAQFFRSDASRFRLVPAVRDLVDFRQLNLCDSLVGLGAFDLICCRNVLIYFDVATRQRICQQFHALLREQGWLLLGTAENLYGIATNFASVRVGDALLYRKVSSDNASGSG